MGGLGRIWIVTIAVVGVGLSAGTAAAHAELPKATATVGQPFSYTGLVYDHGLGSPQLFVDPDHDACGGLSAAIHWGDTGAPNPAGDPATASLVSVPGGWYVNASGSHTYQGRNLGGASVDVDLTCDGHQGGDSYLPWVDVTTVGSGTGGGCTAGQTASLVQMSQISCPIPPYIENADKKVFRTLAGAYYHGAVVDKVIADAIEHFLDPDGGTFIDQLVARRLDKLLEKSFPTVSKILNAPRYAMYLDIVKAAVLTRLADDPPDPNYLQLASPPSLGSLRVKPGRGVSRRGARSATRGLKLDGEAAALHLALLTTVERAGGAHVAGAAAAESAQLRHASDLANRLVTVIARQLRQLKQATRALRRSGVHFRLPRKRIRKARRDLARHGLPAFANKRLKQLGYSAADIDEFGNHATTVPLKSLTTPFPRILGLGAQAKALRAERAALATFASRHAVGK